jgi:two-component system, chemotaxis family, protein-glutamate methylesterase/glutaminase
MPSFPDVDLHCEALVLNDRPLPVEPAAAFDVVAIGASAGGIEALHVVINSLPADFPASVLVVQHLDPRHRSVLAELLGRHSRLPVKQASNGEIFRPGTVYLAAPDAHLLVGDGRLVFSDRPHVHFSRPSIDLLFASVAEAHGDRALGVVLSGTGVDGADGVRAIKARGGRTIVQNPASAAYSGMPHAARATGCADHVLPLEEIGPALVDLAGNIA